MGKRSSRLKIIPQDRKNIVLRLARGHWVVSRHQRLKKICVSKGIREPGKKKWSSHVNYKTEINLGSYLLLIYDVALAWMMYKTFC